QYSPVCFIETKENSNQISKGVHTSSFITAFNENTTKNELIEQFNESKNSWDTISNEHTDNIKFYFNSELNKSYSNADVHSVRVKETIQKLANISSIQTINL
ncbi:MAG: hypothetical protein ACK452_07115, partial [Bacteroidota bacterium]